MRMMLRISVPTVEGNKALKDGSMEKFIEHSLSELKPEAAYFTAEKGQRTAYLFVDIKDSSEMPYFSERFFLAFNATVDFIPVMNAEELRRGLPKALAGIG
ncbi:MULTISPECIES: hypothetical protein [unclassified Mesorhizobium]|uniref:hypothetical protein n=1 Tax=unclassified Mesorhizobium TaxID=325217 RepID=UPI00112DE0B8|nr:MULTISPECIES: hypothetical protein [unclassified Mesorhizobium]TPL05209.1 hypothetical protein FJ567_02545 [Mesorhizobium sp. B2-4-16]TPL74583.1 hypothetical protein FJ956_08030 [Mesorhizobium sp. B2-4-3]